MQSKKTLVIASGNKHKIKEIAGMFPTLNVVGCYEMGFKGDVVEDGKTFYDNALIKAKTISEALKMPVLSDDSGICVKALNEAPGIYSARYAGDGIDEHNNQLLLKNMQGVLDRSAKFVCCIVYYDNGKILSATGETHGYILDKEYGEHGFGYDPLFYSKDLEKCFGLASPEEKDRVSHRFRAVEGIKKLLIKEKVYEDL